MMPTIHAVLSSGVSVSSVAGSTVALPLGEGGRRPSSGCAVGGCVGSAAVAGTAVAGSVVSLADTGVRGEADVCAGVSVTPGGYVRGTSVSGVSLSDGCVTGVCVMGADVTGVCV